RFAGGGVSRRFLTVSFACRSVMFINAPIGLVAILLCQKYLPRTSCWVQNSQLDVPGALTVTAGTILFVYALTNAAVLGFFSQSTVAPLAASLAVTVAILFF